MLNSALKQDQKEISYKKNDEKIWSDNFSNNLILIYETFSISSIEMKIRTKMRKIITIRKKQI